MVLVRVATLHVQFTVLVDPRGRRPGGVRCRAAGGMSSSALQPERRTPTARWRNRPAVYRCAGIALHCTGRRCSGRTAMHYAGERQRQSCDSCRRAGGAHWHDRERAGLRAQDDSTGIRCGAAPTVSGARASRSSGDTPGVAAAQRADTAARGALVRANGAGRPETMPDLDWRALSLRPPQDDRGTPAEDMKHGFSIGPSQMRPESTSLPQKI